MTEPEDSWKQIKHTEAPSGFTPRVCIKISDNRKRFGLYWITAGIVTAGLCTLLAFNLVIGMPGADLVVTATSELEIDWETEIGRIMFDNEPDLVDWIDDILDEEPDKWGLNNRLNNQYGLIV